MIKPIIHIVDDDAATRDAMQELFRSASLASHCYSDAEDFLSRLDTNASGCIIIDLRMPGMSGLELQRALQEQRCLLPVIFLTGHGKVASAVRAMQNGAEDFLTKPVDDEALLDRVHLALRKDQGEREKRQANHNISARLADLTPREYEVLEGVTRGLSNKEIARELGISHKTVELHRAHMMEKMQASSIAEVVRMHITAIRESQTSASEEEE